MPPMRLERGRILISFYYINIGRNLFNETTVWQNSTIFVICITCCLTKVLRKVLSIDIITFSGSSNPFSPNNVVKAVFVNFVLCSCKSIPSCFKLSKSFVAFSESFSNAKIKKICFSIRYKKNQISISAILLLHVYNIRAIHYLQVVLFIKNFNTFHEYLIQYSLK